MGQGSERKAGASTPGFLMIPSGGNILPVRSPSCSQTPAGPEDAHFCSTPAARVMTSPFTDPCVWPVRHHAKRRVSVTSFSQCRSWGLAVIVPL